MLPLRVTLFFFKNVVYSELETRLHWVGDLIGVEVRRARFVDVLVGVERRLP